MFKTIANPDGTISIVPIEQTNNLPFNVGGQLFNQFNNAGAVPNMTSFDPRSRSPVNVPPLRFNFVPIIFGIQYSNGLILYYVLLIVI